MKYVIYADEAWTQSQPLYRYHCFFGGMLSSTEEFNLFEAEVVQLKKDHNYKKEIKWSNISRQHIEFYENLLVLIERFICTSENTKYRQMFMDRSYRYIGESASELDSQFKIYYQFLKHCFGFGYINERKTFTFKLDTHSSHAHKLKLKTFIEGLEIQNVDIRVEFINSKKSVPLQVCDLLMGAAGYYGNKADWDLLPGKRRRTPNQIMKSGFGKKIYDMLRRIDSQFRGSKAFNWFESTGVDGDISNRYHHKMRIWKFIPTNSLSDASWQDDAFGNNKVRKKVL
ncbi:TPA: DUF3800 domain-containing protein [Klebsiella oxytoca]|nr:DUF3800 domain-containing protein [Citrobacter freundii]MDK5879457.1 DUF3800 domain-containing protein [Citrobacter freundii]HCK0217268.1 DUF3800 domain-containing protein [Citrobacter freundii]HCR3767192.1 DUF3800 domain-containing protein [Citrobacter freundii]HEC2164063.1 DUF3800 domain-containing protein [Klebsiella oxytoca]